MEEFLNVVSVKISKKTGSLFSDRLIYIPSLVLIFMSSHLIFEIEVKNTKFSFQEVLLFVRMAHNIIFKEYCKHED